MWIISMAAYHQDSPCHDYAWSGDFLKPVCDGRWPERYHVVSTELGRFFDVGKGVRQVDVDEGSRLGPRKIVWQESTTLGGESNALARQFWSMNLKAKSGRVGWCLSNLP